MSYNSGYDGDIQSCQPCPMENQYHEAEKTVSVPKKQYHSLCVLFFRSNFGKARLCKGLHKTFVRTSLPEELTRSLHVGYYINTHRHLFTKSV